MTQSALSRQAQGVKWNVLLECAFIMKCLTAVDIQTGGGGAGEGYGRSANH